MRTVDHKHSSWVVTEVKTLLGLLVGDQCDPGARAIRPSIHGHSPKQLVIEGGELMFDFPVKTKIIFCMNWFLTPGRMQPENLVTGATE